MKTLATAEVTKPTRLKGVRTAPVITASSTSEALLIEYSVALVRAQTSRDKTDWFDAALAWDRFDDARIAEGKDAAFAVIPMTDIDESNEINQ